MDNVSDHYSRERKERNDFIQEVIGTGTIIESFIVNRGHVGGCEVHSVTDTAIIIIRNMLTGKLITEIIARPAQLKKLYENVGKPVPKWLLRKAYDNNRHRYNEK